MLFNRALDIVLEKGIAGRRDVPTYRLACVDNGGISRLSPAGWGSIVEGPYFPIRETMVGALYFHAVDFGGASEFRQLFKST